MTATTPEQMASAMQEHYGLKVDAIGEDGGMVAMGHPDQRRLIAALNRYYRKEFGESGLGCNYEDAADLLDRRWAVLKVDGEAEHYEWWVETASVTESTSNAFPVTLWTP